MSPIFPLFYAGLREVVTRVTRVTSVLGKGVAMIIKEKRKEVWIRFENRTMYFENEAKLLECLREFPGEHQVVVYLEREKAKRRLHQWVSDAALIELREQFGITNVTETEQEVEAYKSVRPIYQPDPIERIADALEAISSSLDSIDQSLDLISDVLGDCRVKNRNGSAIAITGVIDHV